jgi:hypothetical protein
MRWVVVALVVAVAVPAVGQKSTDDITESGTEQSKELKWQTKDGKTFQGSPLKQEYDSVAKELGYVFKLKTGETIKVPKSQLPVEQIKLFVDITKAARQAAEERARKEKAKTAEVEALQKRRATLAASMERIRRLQADAQGHASAALPDSKYEELLDSILTQFPDSETKLALAILDPRGDAPTTSLATAIQSRGPEDAELIAAAREIDASRLAVLEKMILQSPLFGLSFHGGTKVTRLTVLSVATSMQLKDIDAAIAGLVGAAVKAEGAARNGDSRPVLGGGTLVRPKNGYKDADLEKAWADYDEAIKKIAARLREDIGKQRTAAREAGDLDRAKTYKAMLEALENRGELPAGDAALSESIQAAKGTCVVAAGELEKTYKTVVAKLLKDASLDESVADAVQQEWKSLSESIVPANEAARDEWNGALPIFLSDLQEENFVGNVFGKNGNLGYDGRRNGHQIAINGVFSRKGISTHPPANGAAKVTYKVPVACNHFEAIVGIDDSAVTHSTALVFKVFGDKRLLWTSKPLLGAGKSQDCNVPLKQGTKTVTLVVECPGTHHSAHAVWAEPRFSSK